MAGQRNQFRRALVDVARVATILAGSLHPARFQCLAPALWQNEPKFLVLSTAKKPVLAPFELDIFAAKINAP